MDQQSTRTDITVNVDGFWMLQALLDIRHVAPELRCRPYVSTDNNDWLNEHPGMAVMREQGIVVNDVVNEQVAKRMRPDLRISARVNYTSAGLKAQQLGAEHVVIGEQLIAREFFRLFEKYISKMVAPQKATGQ